MDNNENNILKCSLNNIDYYIYSTKGIDEDSYNYYALINKNNNIEIKDIYNVADYLENFNGYNIEMIKNNSTEYIRFLALKSYAEKIKLSTINKKRGN